MSISSNCSTTQKSWICIFIIILSICQIWNIWLYRLWWENNLFFSLLINIFVRQSYQPKFLPNHHQDSKKEQMPQMTEASIEPAAFGYSRHSTQCLNGSHGLHLANTPSVIVLLEWEGYYSTVNPIPLKSSITRNRICISYVNRCTRKPECYFCNKITFHYSIWRTNKNAEKKKWHKL